MKRIMIATPHMGTITAELGINWCHWASQGEYEVRILPMGYKRPESVARNEIVHAFLGSDSEYLMMIDSDQAVDPGFIKVVEHGKDIVSAVTFSMKDCDLLPMVLDRVEDGFKPHEEIRGGELIRVDGIGSGCFVTHRRVFEIIPAPWFEFKVDEVGTLIMGEDFNFCDTVKQYGFEIYVDTSFVSSHWNSINTVDILSLLNRVSQNAK